ncbi:MAG: HEAT repeat domain-containing protein [Ilumatobacteraceae bacterium]
MSTSADAGAWRRLAVAGHGGDEATAREAMSSDDPVARELALGALSRLGALTADDLHTASSDPHHSVRRRAAVLIAVRTDVTLLPLLHDADDRVVDTAAWAAGEQQPLRDTVDDEVVTRLITLATESGEPLVRESAIAALGAIGDPRGLPAILAGCDDKPAVRRRAVLALAPFDGPEVQAALDAALEDRDWQVRQSAEDVAPFMRPDDD